MFITFTGWVFFVVNSSRAVSFFFEGWLLSVVVIVAIVACFPISPTHRHVHAHTPTEEMGFVARNQGKVVGGSYAIRCAPFRRPVIGVDYWSSCLLFKQAISLSVSHYRQVPETSYHRPKLRGHGVKQTFHDGRSRTDDRWCCDHLIYYLDCFILVDILPSTPS